MDPRFHLETLLHLLREHPLMVEQAVAAWPRDENGALKQFKGLEPTPEALQEQIVNIVVGAEKALQRPSPYAGTTSVTNRPRLLTPDHVAPKGEPKRIPPAFLKENPRLKRMETPLNVEGGPPPKVKRSERKGAFTGTGVSRAPAHNDAADMLDED